MLLYLVLEAAWLEKEVISIIINRLSYVTMSLVHLCIFAKSFAIAMSSFMLTCSSLVLEEVTIETNYTIETKYTIENKYSHIGRFVGLSYETFNVIILVAGV